MPDFKSEWAKVRRGDIYNSALFASSIYTPQPKRRGLTAKQQLQRQITYHPTPNPTVWSEFSGHSQHRTQGYSTTIMAAKSRNAQAVFAQAEYTLSKLRERW
jgi:hypothetical protein